MTRRRWADAADGAIPFVVVGLLVGGGAVVGALGLAWAGNEWARLLLREAGGTLTVWVLRAAFWSLDLIALQTSAAPVNRDWYAPVLAGVALPAYNRGEVQGATWRRVKRWRSCRTRTR